MPWRMHMYINSVHRAGANTSKQQRQIKYVNKLLLQKGTLDVYYVHHTEEFSGYSLHRLFNNTICLEVSTEKTRSTCTPSPHHTALPFSTHMSESEHQHLCKCYFSCGLWYRSVWRGGKCRKRKSSAATAYVVLLWIIPYHSGLVWKCVYAFSSIRQLKIFCARAR